MKRDTYKVNVVLCTNSKPRKVCIPRFCCFGVVIFLFVVIIFVCFFFFFKLHNGKALFSNVIAKGEFLFHGARVSE